MSFPTMNMAGRSLGLAVCLFVCLAQGISQIPKGCDAPAALKEAIRTHPTARDWSALGGWFGERREYNCAVPALETALRKDPNSASNHYYLGLALHMTGHSDQAVDELKRSIELNPRQLQPRLILGLALNALGRQAEAEEAWEAALQVDPNSLVALDWLAKARISSGQFDSAIDLLHSVPRDEDLTLDLALAYSQSKQFDEAIDVLQKALTSGPRSSRLIAALATIYVQSHRYQDASNLLGKAVKAAPKDTALQLLYLRVLVLQDDETAAQPLASRFLAMHPHDFDALYLSGVVENETRQYPLAAEHLREAVALNPKHYDSRFNLGEALSHIGENAAAREQLEEAVALDPSQAQGHFRLAQVLRALGQTDAAQQQLSLFQQCQENTIKLAQAQTNAGQAAQLLKSGKIDEAIALYREAIRAQPQNASFQFSLAQALDRAGKPESRIEERAALEKAVELNPRFALAENQLGLLDVQAGDTSGAERHFRKALAISPSYGDAANNLGTLLGGENREKEAESYFRTAIAANPHAVGAWVNLAATLAGESRLDEARSAVQVALKIDPRDPGALRLSQLLRSAAKDSPRSANKDIAHAAQGRP